jgi:hypothetical protein
VFQAELADGSQALYAATIGGTRCPLSHGYGKYVRDRDITQYERYMHPPPPEYLYCQIQFKWEMRVSPQPLNINPRLILHEAC